MRATAARRSVRVRCCAALLALASTAVTAVAAAPPQRVVTLSPHLAELVCAAGACERLVGRVDYSDYPARVATLPSVGNAFAINPEALLALRPDLVLSWDGGTPAAALTPLQRLGLPVLSIRVQRLDDIGRALLTIGQRLGTADTARAEAARFRQRIDALAARYASARRLRVFYQIEADPIFTINRDSPISQALALCGGDNVFADLPRLAGALGREAVLAADPDVVVWSRQDDTAAIAAFWNRWPQARAVRDGHLYTVDGDTLARATPRMADGIAELCAVLDRAR